MEKVAVTHWSEGAGHASRMLAIAYKLRDEDTDVLMAGGGPGAMFVNMNGFNEFEASTTGWTDKQQQSIIPASIGSLPGALKRFWEMYRWLKKEDPDIVVTDDPFTVITGAITGQTVFTFEHSYPKMFDLWTDKAISFGYHKFAKTVSEEFFWTSLWESGEGDPDNVHRIDPVSHVADNSVDDSFDILIIPGTYSTGFERIKEQLEEKEFDVKMVGDQDWEPVKSMAPYAEEADLVICTGFSSIADAMVAGTPALVYPFISCQRGLAKLIEEKDVEGIQIVHSVDEAVKAAEEPPKQPEFDNGADEVVEQLKEYMTQ